MRRETAKEAYLDFCRLEQGCQIGLF